MSFVSYRFFQFSMPSVDTLPLFLFAFFTFWKHRGPSTEQQIKTHKQQTAHLKTKSLLHNHHHHEKLNWRDKATGVAPFLQISNQTNVLKAALTVVSVVVRVPLLLILTHFLVILPNAPQFVLSSILYVLGALSWWDVQVTGVK